MREVQQWMLPAEARASAGCFFEEDISDQISAIRRQEKAYAEVTENAEFAEKKNPSVRRRGVVALERKNPPLA